MDLRKIKKLIDLLDESNLAELEIKEGEESVRLARMPRGGMVMAAAAPPVRTCTRSTRPAPAPMPARPRASAGHAGKRQGRARRPRGALADGRHLSTPRRTPIRRRS